MVEFVCGQVRLSRFSRVSGAWLLMGKRLQFGDSLGITEVTLFLLPRLTSIGKTVESVAVISL